MTERDARPAEKALKLREHVKKKKPKFVRPESWRYYRLKESWRRPRGLDHKIRRKVKGWPAGVSVGYRGPKIARGLHPSGYREVLVHNSEELKNVDPKTQAVRIAHTVGKRNRVKIITEARRKKITILNVKKIREEKPLAKKEQEEPEEIEEKTEETADTEKPESKKEKTKKRKGRTKTQ